MNTRTSYRSSRLRWPRWLGVGWLGLLGASHLASAADAVVPAADQGFESFKLLYTRNIFNPNRRAFVPGGPARPAPAPRIVERFSLVGTILYEQGSYAFFNGTDSKYRITLTRSNTLGGLTLTEITANTVKLASASNTFELPMDMQMRRDDGGEWQLIAEAASWTTPGLVASEGDRFAGGGRAPTLGGASDRGYSGRDRTPTLDRGFSDRGRTATADRNSDRGSSRRGRTSGGESPAAATVERPSSSGSSASADEVLRRLMQRREQEMGGSAAPPPPSAPAAAPAPGEAPPQS